MEKSSVPRISILGLLLLGISALIAAMIPLRKTTPQTNSIPNGTLRIFSGALSGNQEVLTCMMLSIENHNCHVTWETETTGQRLGTLVQTINGHRYQTNQNTSLSDGDEPIDTTSILVRT